LLCHEVDAAGEEALELLCELKVSVCIGCCGLPVSHVDEKVEVARRLEPIRDPRPEEIEPFDAIAPAEIR